MKKVLIIEDEDAIRAVLEAVTSRAGMQVAVSADLASARAQFSPDLDLLVVDVSLPDGSGIDFIASVRQEGYTGQIIVMTGHADIENPGNLWNHILFKPFSISTFLDLLEQQR